MDHSDATKRPVGRGQKWEPWDLAVWMDGGQ